LAESNIKDKLDSVC